MPISLWWKTPSPDDVGTKIYDYIFWNKPVVAVVPPEGPLAKLLSGFANGFVCTTSDEVRAAVERIAAERLDCLDPNLDRDRFSRRHQNKLIEGILEDAVKEAASDDTHEGRPAPLHGS